MQRLKVHCCICKKTMDLFIEKGAKLTNEDLTCEKCLTREIEYDPENFEDCENAIYRWRFMDWS
jgi:hypothetical protein